MLNKKNRILCLIFIFLFIFTNIASATEIIDEGYGIDDSILLDESMYLEDMTPEKFINIFHSGVPEESKEQLKEEFGQDIEFVPREPLVIYDEVGESYIIDRTVDVIKDGEIIHTEQVFNFPFFDLPEERGAKLEGLINQMLGEEVAENTYKLKDVPDEVVGEIAMTTIDNRIDKALDLGTEEELLEEIMKASRLEEFRQKSPIYFGVTLIFFLIIFFIRKSRSKKVRTRLPNFSRRIMSLILVFLILAPTVVDANEFIWRNDNYRTGHAKNPIRTPVHKSATLSGYSEGGTPLISGDNNAYTYDATNRRIRKTQLQGPSSRVTHTISNLNAQPSNIYSSGAFWGDHLVITYSNRVEVRRLSDLALVRSATINVGSNLTNNPLVIGNYAYTTAYGRIVRLQINTSISVVHKVFDSFTAEGGTRQGQSYASPTQVRTNLIATGINQWGSGSSSSYPRSSFGRMLVYNSSLSSVSARTLTAGVTIPPVWTGSSLVYTDVRGTLYRSTVNTSGTLGAPVARTIRSGHSGGSSDHNTWTRMIMPRNITYDGSNLYVDMRGVPTATNHIEKGIYKLGASFGTGSSYPRLINISTRGAQVMTATASQGNVLLVQDTSGYINAYNTNGARVNNFFTGSGAATSNSRMYIGTTLSTGSAAINGGIGGYIAVIGGGSMHVFNTADSTAPSISFSPNGSAWRRTSLGVTVTITDSGNGAISGVHKVWTYLSTSSTPPVSTSSNWGSPVRNFTNYQLSTTASVTIPASTGNRYIHVKATDRLGNERISTSSVYRTDATNPSGSFNPNSRGWSNADVSPSFTPTDTGGSGVDRWRYRTERNGTWSSWTGWNWSGSSSFGNQPEGSNRIQVEVRDNAGNTNTITSGYYRVDKSVPSVSANPTSRTWGKNNASTTISISDSGSGIRDVLTIVNTSSSMPADSDSRWISRGSTSSYSQTFSSTGNNYIHVWARDNAGNITRKTFGPYRVDKTAPNATIKKSPTGWTNGAVDITISASDSHSGIKSISQVGGTSKSGAKAVFSVSKNGTYRFIIEDNAGNTREVSTIVNNIDKTPPIIELFSKKDIDTGHVALTTKVTDGDSGVKNVKYQISNSIEKPTNWQTGSSEFTIDLDVVGTYYMHIEATDVAGNVTYVRSSEIIIEEPLGIDYLIMTNIIRPPSGTTTPIYHPVTYPTEIKAGYKMTFELGVNRTDQIEINILANGNPVNVYTDKGLVDTIIIPTSREDKSIEYTFWLDKNMSMETILDMSIKAIQFRDEGDKILLDNELGKSFGIIKGSSKRDANINLTN